MELINRGKSDTIVSVIVENPEETAKLVIDFLNQAGQI